MKCVYACACVVFSVCGVLCVCVCGIVCVLGALLGKPENLISGMHCASLPLTVLTMPACGERDGRMDGCVSVRACSVGQ